MKLDDYQIDCIKELHQMGYSSRKIASWVNCSKSSVNNHLQAMKKVFNPERKPNETNILILDIETSADVVATFGRRNVNIGESNILYQGNEIISAAWKFIGDDNVSSMYSTFDKFRIGKNSEARLLTNLVQQIKRADAVVIHNARFDLGTIQHRRIL